MNNLKDKLTNYVALILVLLGGVKTYLEANAGQPFNWSQFTLFVAGAIIAFFTGKASDGTAKKVVDPLPPKP